MRKIIDILFIFIAGFFVLYIGGSVWQSIFAQASVACYGIWCFYDGAKRIHDLSMQAAESTYSNQYSLGCHARHTILLCPIV